MTGANAVTMGGARLDRAMSLAPLLGGLLVLPIALQVPSLRFQDSMLLLLGMPHYFATATFFFDPKNRGHYRERPFAFAIIPLILLAFLGLGAFTNRLALPGLVVLLWNVYHVSMQNFGVASIFRGAGPALERTLSKLALAAAAYGFFLIGWPKDPILGRAGLRLGLGEATLLGPLLLGLAGLATTAILIARARRRASWPVFEMTALVAGLLQFWPYAILEDRGLANALLLTGHFAQYLLIVFVLSHRKYGALEGDAPPDLAFLRAGSRSPSAALLAWLAIVAAVFGVDRGIHALGLMRFHDFALYSIVLLHFYFDGLVWSLRDPFVRAAVLPHLTRTSHA